MAPVSNLTKLTHLRTQLIATRVRISAFIETFDIATEDVFGLQARLTSLEKTYDDFSQVQLDIEYIVLSKQDHEEDLAECDVVRTTFENEYFRLKPVILTHIQSIQSANTVQVLPRPTAAIEAGELKLRLPTINLPTFDGKFENWLTFKDTYSSLIHDNKSLKMLLTQSIQWKLPMIIMRWLGGLSV